MMGMCSSITTKGTHACEMLRNVREGCIGICITISHADLHMLQYLV